MSDSGKAVFLSYASQDAEAAKRICDALRAAGVEVWFDQSELVGGDQWDGKIRGQIGSCALFVPIISANTQVRLEGYFRLEWKLAAQRTHTMADEMTFLLPVVIDDTRDTHARVPAEFKSVQWTRLPGGETPAAFSARVKNLLEGEVAQASPTARHPAAGGTPALNLKAAARRRRWLLPAFLGLASLVTLSIWQPWKPGSPPAPAAASPAAPLSEARQLTLKAQALIDDDLMAVRENFRLADELCQQAVGLDSKDGEAWATWARVSAAMVEQQYDRTPQRREAARRQAERAIRLAPNSVEARLAMAAYFAVTLETAEAERRLRDLLRQAPTDARVALALAQALDRLGRAAEASDIRLNHAAFAGNDPRPLLQEANALLGTGRLVEAEALVERAHALAPTLSSYRAKLRLVGLYWGDLEAAKQTLDQAPPGYLLEAGPANLAALIWLWRGEPEKALDLLRRLPGDIFEGDNAMRPKGYYSGWAHQLAGRAAAAQAEWKQALAAVARQLVAEPNNASLLNHQSLLFALTGQKEEAEKMHRLRVEIGNDRVALMLWSVDARSKAALALDARHVATFFLAVDKPEEAIRVLQGVEVQQSAARALHLNNLRYDPWYAPIRKDPRIQKIIVEGEAWLNELRRAGATPAGVKSTASAVPVPDAKSVAVLAFANLSDDKSNEYFSDGISEELLNVLAKIPGLKVTARTSSFHFKGKDTPIPEIAQQLGVSYVIEGSVRKQGDKVRITAQLIKAADGFHVWSDTFTRDLKDIFAVQDEIAGLIAQQLQLKLGESARVTKVVNPEAYRLLLEGRQFWNLRSEEGFTKAETAFTKALALDPQFAEAHAGLGGVCVIRAVYRVLDAVPLEANDLARAVSEGRRALEIDPSSAEALAVLGYAQMMGNQLAEADRHFQRALGLNPNSALVHCWYALLLNAEGQLDAAIRHYQKAAEVDPLWFINLHMMGNALISAQRYDQALGISERAEALRTEVFLPTESQRARALLALGRKEEAFTAARQILHSADLRPRWDSDALAIHVLLAGGRRQEAENEGARLLAHYPEESYLRGFALAALGRFDEALPFLQHTPSVMGWRIYWDTMWDPWRDDPRFLQLMVQLGRAEEYKVARATLARMQSDAAKK